MIARWRPRAMLPRRPGTARSRGNVRRLLAAHRPSPFEVFGDGDPRFTRPLHHALKSRDRLFVALEGGLRRLADELLAGRKPTR